LRLFTRGHGRAEAVAPDVNSWLALSQRQFEVPWSRRTTRRRARELNAMPASQPLKIIGKKTH
jgi:hypothetical protein